MLDLPAGPDSLNALEELTYGNSVQDSVSSVPLAPELLYAQSYWTYIWRIRLSSWTSHFILLMCTTTLPKYTLQKSRRYVEPFSRYTPFNFVETLLSRDVSVLRLVSRITAKVF